MKVRRKNDPPHGEFEVHQELAHAYLTTCGCLLNKDFYEPVPAPDRWEDVTGECEVEVDARGECYVKHLPADLYVTGEKNYRLRKVQLKREQGEHLSDLNVWAFLVERKA